MLFYSGLVSELYASLRASDPDPSLYARFIARSGEPALELGCGDGDPLLDLLEQGLDVEGVDISPDMLRRTRERAAARGLAPVLHRTAMEDMRLQRRFRSIFLAGATFCLLHDDAAALAALEAIAAHLEPRGSVLIPLFVPQPVRTPQVLRELRRPDGAVLRVTALDSVRDEVARVQTTRLRYERVCDETVEIDERAWRLHWYERAQFEALACRAGLDVARTIDGGADAWSVILRGASCVDPRPQQP